MKKRIRYLLTLVAMLLTSSITAYGEEDFDPAFPSEPGTGYYTSRIVLLRNLEEGGTVSGAGKYPIDTEVNVYAYCNTGYSFVNWTDTQGNSLSDSRTFSFVNTDKADTLIANFAFDPDMPGEPNDPSTIVYYRLVLKDTEGLTVSGGGRYKAGTKAKCVANIESGYTFLGWYSKDGTLQSESRSFNYTMPVGGDTLTALCVFDPFAPSEPNDPILKHNLTVTCSEGGYWRCSKSESRLLEGTTFSLSASKNEGYDFKGWYLNGELYTELSSFTYTMGKEDLNFYAEFLFNPEFPSEPLMPDVKSYQYYLMTVNGMPGDTVKYPIMLVNTKEIKDILIRITFPKGMTPNLDDFTIGANAQGYTVSLAEAVDTISIIEDGAQLWDFSMIGGTVTPGVDALLTFDVAISKDLGTGGKHQVKINQISMINGWGEHVTARTRNGRIGVYKRGDSNGDDRLSISDIVKIVEGTKEDAPVDETFIKEVSDLDDNGIIDSTDIEQLSNILIEKENIVSE